MSETVERGKLFLFYRNKVDVEVASSLDDVQRAYMILVRDHEGDDEKADEASARLFLIGRKRLPPIIEGEANPNERQWMMITAVGAPEELAQELLPLKYETKTRGERVLGEAIPVAAARYEILAREGNTFLTYRLVRPTSPKRAQEELGVRPEAAYVIAVRNPSLDVPGFPDAKPDYPKRLREAFADRRWIEIADPELLDHEDAQLVLIGAHEDLDELEVDLSGEAELFETLGLDESAWPRAALDEGEFCEARFPQPP